MSTLKRYDAKTASFSPARGQVKPYGFTLIELLVVIAIIAILAAILLPALQSARKRGKTSNCNSNQKQMGQIFSFYTNDFGSYFVNHDVTSYNRGSLDDMSARGWCWGNLYSLLYAKSAKAASRSFMCTVPANFNAIDNTTSGRWTYTYGAAYVKISQGRFAFNLRHPGIQKNGFSKTMVIGCAGKGGNGGTPFCKITTKSYSASYGQIATLHNRRGNLLFIDGHSASHTAHEIANGAAKTINYSDGVSEITNFCMGKWGATRNRVIKAGQ